MQISPQGAARKAIQHSSRAWQEDLQENLSISSFRLDYSRLVVDYSRLHMGMLKPTLWSFATDHWREIWQCRQHHTSKQLQKASHSISQIVVIQSSTHRHRLFLFLRILLHLFFLHHQSGNYTIMFTDNQQLYTHTKKAKQNKMIIFLPLFYDIRIYVCFGGRYPVPRLFQRKQEPRENQTFTMEKPPPNLIEICSSAHYRTPLLLILLSGSKVLL
eukprot:gene2135-1310_t